MTIVVESVSNTPTLGSRTTTTVTAPSGITNGDVLVFVVHVGNASTTPVTVTPPAGVNEVSQSPAERDDGLAGVGGTYSIAMHVYTKVASGESGSYAFTHSTADTEGYCYRLSGVDNSTPVDATPVKQVSINTDPGEGSPVNGQTTGYATITTVTNGAFLIYAESDWDGPGAGSVSGSTPTISVRRSGGITWIGDGTLATAGATSARTRTNGNSSTANPWTSIIVALRPSTGATLVLGDRVLDSGLSALDTDCDKIYVCSQTPTTYTEATSTYALGNKNWGAGNAFASPAAKSGGGRQITSVAITDGSVTAGGTVAVWAAVDSANSRLLASGNLTGGKAVTNGQVFTLGALTLGIPNA